MIINQIVFFLSSTRLTQPYVINFVIVAMILTLIG